MMHGLYCLPEIKRPRLYKGEAVLLTAVFEFTGD